jgi:hypothetical protein
VTKSAYSFNPTTTSKTFECCATRQNMGDDWMAPLTVYCDDYHYVALSWGVGGEHGGSDTVMAMEVHTPSGHPSSIGGNVVCGRFYEFRLVVTPPSTFNGYYRAQGSDPWSLIASVSYSYDAMAAPG